MTLIRPLGGNLRHEFSYRALFTSLRIVFKGFCKSPAACLVLLDDVQTCKLSSSQANGFIPVNLCFPISKILFVESFFCISWSQMFCFLLTLLLRFYGQHTFKNMSFVIVFFKRKKKHRLHIVVRMLEPK